MPEGTVMFFNAQEGSGLIIPDDGGQVLPVHDYSIRTDRHRKFQRGERVSYKIEQHVDGPRAVEVSPLGQFVDLDEQDNLTGWPAAFLILMGTIGFACLIVGVVLVSGGQGGMAAVQTLVLGCVLLTVVQTFAHRL